MRNLKLNKYGNTLGGRNKITRLLKRKNVFQGTINGVAGMWQRWRKILSFEITRDQYDFSLNFEAKSFDIVGAIILKVKASRSIEDGVLLATININSIRKAGQKAKYKAPKSKPNLHVKTS